MNEFPQNVGWKKDEKKRRKTSKRLNTDEKNVPMASGLDQEKDEKKKKIEKKNKRKN